MTEKKSIESVKNEYQDLVNKYSEEKENISKLKFWISILRFSVFLIILFSLYTAVKYELSSYWVLSLVAIIAFLFLIRFHSKLFNKYSFLERLIKINQEELLALEGDWSSFENGNQFEPDTHDFSKDMDLFGENSLYNKTNRTSTLFGAKRLANIFLNLLLDSNEIILRQQAVSELSNNTNFWQKFRAHGLSFKENEKEYDFIKTWKDQSSIFIDKPFFRVLIYAVPIINLSVLGLFSFDLISGKLLSFLLILTLMLVVFYQKKINQVHKKLSKRTAFLEKYVELLQLIEVQEFKSELLIELQLKLQTKHKKAFECIKGLSKILSALDSRLNIIAGIILNAFFIWDIKQILKMEQWKKDNITKLETWFDVIASFDALNSLSVLSHNNPDWITPTISKEEKWQFKEMKHPLMDSKISIANDYYVDRIPYLSVITGANMAGKSTYLRTLGSNLVLAMIGAVVNAKSFTFYPIQIVSSLRTTDSLMKSESYFYAEIKRLQMIVQRLRSGESLFVLLDEILKGTNSHDKEEGSKALLNQLIKLKAVGIIATHDLSLGKLSNIHQGIIENKCFEVDIIDDQLSFDYKLRDGVAKNMNASFLLEKMGITTDN